MPPGEMEKIPVEVRLARGVAVVLLQIEERFPVGIEDLLPLLIANPYGNFFTPTRIAALLNAFAQADLAIRNMVKYFDNQLGVSASIRVEDAMLNAEKQLKENEGKSEDELLEIIQCQIF
ncbi:hypothetical protein NLA06_07990 [Desulfomicrobium sp. ZS1]|uniref:hypothetical protein n=1 Tax=Desulfomicrobium sp. ZS1 TaxID=2952228 RepID=UPI0020B45D97|nr:hypothetical protein [Desulfomicrobium sp. ZS1]UTF51814.1 hypothetical protein NLA06_07990 [Desulfomicrobium sp. ZS1]